MSRIYVQNSDHLKIDEAQHFFKNNCFNTSQLKQVLQTLSNDYNKYNLAISVHPKMTDTFGFHTVGNTFRSKTYKQEFREYLFLQEHRNNRGIPSHGRLEYRALNYPNLNYPDVSCYNGATYGGRFVRDYEFNKLAIMLFRMNSERQKEQQFQFYMQRHVFTTAQFMKLLTLIDNLSVRYNLAIRNHGLLYDSGNAWAIEQVFGSSAYSGRYRFYMRQNSIPGLRVNPARQHNNRHEIGSRPYRRPMIVSDLEMRQIIQTIKNESFSTRRIELAKTIIQSKGAFTTQQIAYIMQLMSFDSGKLDIAKFAYSYTVDKDNYYLLANQLTFSSNKTNLLRFIRTNP